MSAAPSSLRRLILLALLLSLAIGVLFARAIWTMREDQQRFARDTNTNLVLMLDQTIARTVEAFDTSLQGVGKSWATPKPWHCRTHCATSCCLTTRCV